jgi:hypothetical protein
MTVGRTVHDLDLFRHLSYEEAIMDAIRKPYTAPAVVSEGTVETLTRVNLPPFISDASKTGKALAEGSLGFML